MTLNTPNNYTKQELKKRHPFKWAVGKPDSRRSTAWCLKGDKKGDVYLFANTAGGEWKISVHRDRNCHYGFTDNSKTLAKEKFGLDRRHLDRWKLPDGPVVHAISIIIPESELAELPTINETSLHWIDGPSKEMAVVFSLYIEESDAVSISLNLPPHIKLLVTTETNSRRSYLTYCYIALDTKILELIANAKQCARTHELETNAIDSTDKLRILLPLQFNGAERCFVEADIP